MGIMDKIPKTNASRIPCQIRSRCAYRIKHPPAAIRLTPRYRCNDARADMAVIHQNERGDLVSIYSTDAIRKISEKVTNNGSDDIFVPFSLIFLIASVEY